MFYSNFSSDNETILHLYGGNAAKTILPLTQGTRDKAAIVRLSINASKKGKKLKQFTSFSISGQQFQTYSKIASAEYLGGGPNSG